jgi:hypothetical protein
MRHGLSVRFLPIWHYLDLMYIERNISNNFLKHLFAGHRDMEAAGKFPHLHLRP